MLGRTQPGNTSNRPGQPAANLALANVGLTIAFSVFVGFGIGLGLDRLLHTRPWLMLAGLLLGIAAGFVGLYRETRSAGGD